MHTEWIFLSVHDFILYIVICKVLVHMSSDSVKNSLLLVSLPVLSGKSLSIDKSSSP